MKTCHLALCIMLASSLSFSATNIHAANSDKKLSVFVSIMPAVYFVRQIGGNLVNVRTLVQPGQSPATYAATPKQMARLAKADIYFKIGVPFENSLIPKIRRSLPHLIIRDLQENINLLKLLEHGHDDEKKNSDQYPHELDPHSWLDPQLVIHHAGVITDSLIDLDPEHKQQYSANYRKFTAELQQLDQTLRRDLQPFSGQSIYVFHPAYGYFCKAYNLVQKAVVIDGKEPGAKHLARLIKSARKDKVQAIFIQSQFSGKTANAIARVIGATIVRLDPLALDYMTNMKHIAKEIIKHIQVSPKQTEADLL